MPLLKGGNKTYKGSEKRMFLHRLDSIQQGFYTAKYGSALLNSKEGFLFVLNQKHMYDFRHHSEKSLSTIS